MLSDRTIPIKAEGGNKLGPMEANVKHTLAQRPISNSKSNSDFVRWILKVYKKKHVELFTEMKKKMITLDIGLPSV